MGREEIQKAAQKTMEKQISEEFLSLANLGKMEPWGDQTNVKPLLTVSVSKTDQSYTLVENGITLTQEQAAQIYGAYKAHNKK